MKMDVESTRKVHPVIWQYAKRIVDNQLEAAFSTTILSHEETMEHLFLKKGPGYPARYHGYKSRGQLMRNPDYVAFLNEYPECIWTVTPKLEFEEEQLILNGKIRTFVIPPLHLLYWQIRYYTRQNENMKNLWWSKYGFNPFGGGTNILAEELLARPYRGYYDIAGYDRKLNLDTVYERRNRFLEDGEEARKKWLYENTVSSILLMTNGDICAKERGNNSGSGCTTPDNIVAGMEMATYSLVHAYYDLHGKLPASHEVTDQCVNLYGDDNVAAVTEDFKYYLDEPHLKKYLSHFSMELKEFKGGLDLPLSELSFLGFSFRYITELNLYLPLWKQDRLYTGLVFEIGLTPLWKYLQRFYSILLLSFPHNGWLDLRAEYLSFLNSLRSNPHPMVKVAVSNGAPNSYEMMMFYTGYESGSGVNFLPLGGGILGPKKIRQSTLMFNDRPKPKTQYVYEFEPTSPTHGRPGDHSISGSFRLVPRPSDPTPISAHSGNGVESTTGNLSKLSLGSQSHNHGTACSQADPCRESAKSNFRAPVNLPGHELAYAGNYIGALMSLSQAGHFAQREHATQPHDLPVGTDVKFLRSKYDSLPDYSFIPSGPHNSMTWSCSATVILLSSDEVIHGNALSSSKKIAQNAAAKQVWEELLRRAARHDYMERANPDPIPTDDDISFIRCLRSLVNDSINSTLDPDSSTTLESNPLQDLLFGDEKAAAARLAMMRVPGTFSEYGNRQMSKPVLSKKEWMEKSKLRFDKQNLSRTEREARYANYATRVSSIKPRQAPGRAVPRNVSREMQVRASAIRTKRQMAPMTGRSTLPSEESTRPSQFAGESKGDNSVRGGPQAAAKLTKLGFSKCSILYAMARINSFQLNEPPCIPDEVVLVSYKYGAFTRGNFTIGTNAVSNDGFVAQNPYSPGNTNLSVSTTTAAYVNSGYTIGGVGVLGLPNNSPFPTANFLAGGVPQNYFRVVGAGIRARYMGSELNRSGRYIMYRDANNNNIQTNPNSSFFMNTLETTSCPVGPDWCYCHFSPAIAQDLVYGNAVAASFLCNLILVNGGVSGTVFEFEAVWWFEATGPLLPVMSASSSDPQGFAVTQSALATTQPTQTPASSWKSFLTEASSIVKDTLSFIGPAAKAAAMFF